MYNAFENNEVIGGIRGDWIMEQSKPIGAVVQELDELYVMLRGARYANALNDAKKCFQEKNYPETLRLVRETGELHRRMHLQVIKQDPQKAGGKKEVQKILEKQAKLNDSLERFGKLAALLEKMAKLSAEKSTAPVSARPRPAEQVRPADAGDAPLEEPKSQATWLIDAGTFSQLQTAAQQTGLLANADAIGFVRDHEFRTGMYQQAFDRIEGLSMHMRSAAEQRARRLRQEEFDYKGGILKMSPKEWMIKQQRDLALTQKIDRTLRYFARVLDALRVLITASFETME